MLGHDDLQWRGTALHFGRRKLLTIVPDAQYPKMWRVRYPDGRLSDMVNRARAEDAAVGVALRIANPKRRQRAPAGPPMSFGGDQPSEALGPK
jgi:hypothetical protein